MSIHQLGSIAIFFSITVLSRKNTLFVPKNDNEKPKIEDIGHSPRPKASESTIDYLRFNVSLVFPVGEIYPKAMRKEF